MASIAQIAYDLISDQHNLPIQVEYVAARCDIKLLSYDLGENISGVLITEKGKSTIGYNKNEPRVRNRFTIAHELGHYILHKDELDFFVDKAFKVMYRGNNVPGINFTHEKQANEFAACLLMPEHLLRKEIDDLDLDYTDEDAIKTLAKKFDVSTIAMSIRIAKLGLLTE
ncbi:MAG: ImmA/IrrE family metallo-endopeptidase [Williamsia sp.]|nr:ImmA/IrrE family metallo-endopeptidase [Williamsia sp.]